MVFLVLFHRWAGVVGHPGKQGEFLCPSFFLPKLQAVRSQFRPEQTCEVLWQVPSATVLVSTIPWVPAPVPLPASGERVRDGRWIGLLAQLQGLPVVSPRPKSLSTTLKCTDNYTQKMCSDSSGNQHIQCTGMKPLRLSDKTNKTSERWIVPLSTHGFAVGQQICF